MRKELLSASEASAYGAKLARVQSVPNFESHFSATIAKSMGKTSKESLIFNMETQGSAVTAAIGNEASGKRTFLPISSLTSIQELRQASFMRMPIVAVNVSRSIALNSDQNDVMALRDSGWLMFFPENNQEILDSIILSYRICEDNRVLLPSIINIDFPTAYETVSLPTEQSIDKFLPKLKLPAKIGDANMGVPVENRREFVMQQQAAMSNSLKVIQKAGEQWKGMTKRSFGMTESFMLDDADYALVISGYHSPTAKEAVIEMRKNEKVGLLRLLAIRPWPDEEIMTALKNVKKIAVIDQNVSLGSSGVLFPEIKACSDGFASNFISLGYLNKEDFFDIIKKLKSQEKPERVWL